MSGSSGQDHPVIGVKIRGVNGHGLATNIRQRYPAGLLYAIVGLLLIANTINIAAEIAAMAAALKLIIRDVAHQL